MDELPSNLAPPAARQGPGPMPPGMLEALDVAMERRISSAFIGDRRAAGATRSDGRPDDPLGLQRPHGLPNSGPAHIEQASELALGGQLVADMSPAELVREWKSSRVTKPDKSRSRPCGR